MFASKLDRLETFLFLHIIHNRTTSGAEAAESQTLSVGALPFVSVKPQRGLRRTEYTLELQVKFSVVAYKILSPTVSTGKSCPLLHLSICILYGSPSSRAAFLAGWWAVCQQVEVTNLPLDLNRHLNSTPS